LMFPVMPPPNLVDLTSDFFDPRVKKNKSLIRSSTL